MSVNQPGSARVELTRSELTVALLAYLTAAPASTLAGASVEVLEQWAGEENLLWRVAAGTDVAVVKLFVDAGYIRSRRQHEAQVRFAPLGLAPEAFWFDRAPEGLPFALVAYRWADAAPLPQDAGLPLELAHALARIHTADPSGHGTIAPHALNLDYYWRLERAGLQHLLVWLAEGPCVRLHRALAQALACAERDVALALPLWHSAASHLVHGDVRVGNILISPAALLLVDWENAGLGDPALETATLLHRSRQMPRADLAAWLAAYLDWAELPGLDGQIEAYRRLLPLRDVTYLLSGLRDHARGPEQTELNQALPFVLATLAASLATAAQVAGLDLDAAPRELVAELTAWLVGESAEPTSFPE